MTSLLKQHLKIKKAAVTLSQENDDATVETPVEPVVEPVEPAEPVATTVVEIENAEKVEINEVEDADLIGEEKAEMVAALESHIEDSIEEVAEQEVVADVLEDQADIMENLANSGDATPGAVTAAVAGAGLLINQLGVDVEGCCEGEEQAPVISVSQESIANDHVQALVVSMEGVKELARNIRNAYHDQIVSVLRGLSTLFKTKAHIAKAIADKASKESIPQKVMDSFKDAKSRDFDIVPYYDLFVSEDNAGSAKLKTDWNDTYKSIEHTLTKGLADILSTYEEEVKVLGETDWRNPESVKVAMDLVAKNKDAYSKPFKSKLNKFNDLCCSGMVEVTLGGGKFGGGRTKEVAQDRAAFKRFRKHEGELSTQRSNRTQESFACKFPTRVRYETTGAQPHDKLKPLNKLNKLSIAVSSYIKKAVPEVTGVGSAMAVGLARGLELGVQINSVMELALTPSMTFVESDLKQAVDFVEKCPALIEKAIADVQRLEKANGVWATLKQDFVNAKTYLKTAANIYADIDNEVLIELLGRPQAISRLIVDLVFNEVMYANIVQKRTYNFLRGFAAYSRTSVSTESADLTYTEEGFTGGLKGWFGGAYKLGWYTEAAEKKLQKLREDIDEVADRIAKLQNGQLAEVKAKGLELPAEAKNIDAEAVKKAFWKGMFYGGYYGASQGSKLQDENEKLQKLLKQLDEELKKAEAEKPAKKK